MALPRHATANEWAFADAVCTRVAAVLAPIRLADTGASTKKPRTLRQIGYKRRYARRRGPEQHSYLTPPAQTFYAIGLLIGFAISHTGMSPGDHVGAVGVGPQLSIAQASEVLQRPLGVVYAAWAASPAGTGGVPARRRVSASELRSGSGR